MSQDPVLLLRICGKGFAKLAAGQIKAKYREAKPYWQKRLLKPDGQPRSFSAIHIRNGYRADAPLAVFAFGGISAQRQEHEGKSATTATTANPAANLAKKARSAIGAASWPLPIIVLLFSLHGGFQTCPIPRAAAWRPSY